jgi:aspartate aminotransferase
MMAERIIKMRDVLYDALVKLETPGNWGHIKSQIGMFSFTGSELSHADSFVGRVADSIVTTEQVNELAEYAHVYMTKDGRISMAGLNDHNVQVRYALPENGQCRLTPCSTSQRA